MTVHVRVPLHDQGPALWPQYIDEAQLQRWREAVGTPLFETMWQGREGGLRGQIIREAFFGYYGALPARRQDYMAIDPAISEKTVADETAIVVGSLDEDGMLSVRFVWSGRVGIREQAEIIHRTWDYYRPVSVGIEDVAFLAALIQYVQQEHPELPIEPVNPGGRDKLTRFLGLGALYEFGRVWHHPSLKGSAFERQLTRLPNARHDDLADATVYLTKLSGIGSTPVISGKRPEGFR
jgi:phage terminase large subunit-like protein